VAYEKEIQIKYAKNAMNLTGDIEAVAIKH